MKLQFNKNGLFKIVHMTDIQESAKVSPDTVKLIKVSAQKLKPDLVIMTGDQIKCYALGLGGKNAKKTVESMIKKICSPLEELKIPFAITFGNHDVCNYVSKEDEIEMFSKYKYFVKPLNNAYDLGTYSLPIYSSDGKKIAYNLYIIDSQGNRKGGGYEAVKPEQIAWYKAQRDKLIAQNGGENVKSMAFQHIPVCEVYNILKKVKKGTKNSIRCYRTHANEHYLLDENKCFEMFHFGEPCSVPDENTGEFEAMAEKGDVKAIFCGHDHKNCFVGTYKGVDLGYTPSCGFNTYGDGKLRSVREITLNENNNDNYETKPYTFIELCGKRVKRPFYDMILKYFPTTVDDAIHKALKILAVIAALVVIIVLLIELL